MLSIREFDSFAEALFAGRISTDSRHMRWIVQATRSVSPFSLGYDLLKQKLVRRNLDTCHLGQPMQTSHLMCMLTVSHLTAIDGSRAGMALHGSKILVKDSTERVSAEYDAFLGDVSGSEMEV